MLFISILLITGGCSNVADKVDEKCDAHANIAWKYPPAVTAFLENYSYSMDKENVMAFENTYVIKGVAGNVYKHGRNIRVIEDLKGNFDGKSTIFVWGSGSDNTSCVRIPHYRMDHITRYQKNDVLMMVVGRIPEKSHWHCSCFWGIENPGDYETSMFGFSVVKISKDNVTGFIMPADQQPWANMSLEEQFSFFENLPDEERNLVKDAMPWEDFQALLKSVEINPLRPWWFYDEEYQHLR